MFPNSADDYLTVHDRGADYADVTEGSGGAWERLHYDWSDPRRVVMTTTDSNAWGDNSGHTYTFTPLPDGTTRVDATVVRDGKNFKGKFFAVLFKARREEGPRRGLPQDRPGDRGAERQAVGTDCVTMTHRARRAEPAAPGDMPSGTELAPRTRSRSGPRTRSARGRHRRLARLLA